ncbi:hypothetical protein HY468_05605, partial [Candidatus Roizmanbacteria bacterium]|nr:hypothetical protein [Candidatus Roizmanbacteria bacterium]
YVGYQANQQTVDIPIVQPTQLSTPSPILDETAGWKTYTNSEIGFTLQYPMPSTITTCQLDNDDYPKIIQEHGLTRIYVTPGDPCSSLFLVSLIPNPSNLDPLDFFKSKFDITNCKQQSSNNSLLCSKEEFTAPITNEILTSEYEVTNRIIDRKDGIYVKTIRTLGESADYVYITGSKGVMIEIIIVPATFTDKILSTFRFVEEGEEIADWTKYTNAQYSFSLQHPPSWQVSLGNKHAPSMPAAMINLQSKTGSFDMSIIPGNNDLKKDLKEEVTYFIQSYLGDVDLTYKDTTINNLPAVEGAYVQSAMGSETKIIVIAVEKDDTIFFFHYQQSADTTRSDLYNQILSSFQFTE